MTDELARAKKLELSDLEKPYFIQYVSSDGEDTVVFASLGGITSSRSARVRRPSVIVRVGDYAFDNTNSIFSGFPPLGLMPLDDDYGVIRTEFWRATDVAYKSAVDQIARKRNALREIADPDKTADLAPAKVIHEFEPIPTSNFNRSSWESLLRQVSGIFASHAGVMTSSVNVRSITSTYRMINSEGSAIRLPQTLDSVQIRATAVAPDGNHVWNHEFVTELESSKLPESKELAKLSETVASQTEALAKAPQAEDYSGPVLFESEAAAQMMAQVLADAITPRRKPVAPPGSNDRSLQVVDSVWASKIGVKVAPDWMNVWDDPLAAKFEGRDLVGYYKVDDEGVAAQKVSIVEKGIFRNYLLSRVPFRTFNGSNGHGRLPGPFGSEAGVIGNLFVQSSAPVPESQLKSRLLERVKSAGLKFGVVARRLDFPSTAPLGELQGLVRQMQKNGFVRTLNSPLLAYLVYPDGREELVRGFRFREFSAKDLRDLDAASDKPFVFNYVNNGSGLNYADAGSDATTSSVICPALLFDSLELAKAENEIGAPPIVPPPALVPAQR
jgi:hypothetical protein